MGVSLRASPQPQEANEDPMNWYRENRWLGNFLIAFGVSLLLALWFLSHARGEFTKASSEFNEVAAERMRLEHLSPFPNEENFQRTQAALENYGATLDETKDSLKMVVPSTPLAPTEFQSRLRQAIVGLAERARANRVKFPENFHLGFDEFIAALPDTAASPLLGQQLNQVQLLVSILIDNHVDAITSLKRPTGPAEPLLPALPAGRKRSAEDRKIVERSVVDVAFTASPTALRKVLNQIASFDRQFFIVRTLHVRNEQQKGPLREQSAGASNQDGAANATASPAAIKFIVGNEHLEAAASIELVRFTF
jgi:hypothetical protein